MDDLAETLATYESVAERYCERWADRESVAGMLERFLDICDGKQVLDVGCGPGWESASISEDGRDVVGIDLTPSFLDAAREQAPAAEFVRMDMRQLGLADETFDGLWASASFLHVPRAEAGPTLREFHRVLRPGGTLFLSVKCGQGIRTGSTYDEDERQFVLWEADELREQVVDAGFTVDAAESGPVTADDWVRLYARA